MKRKTLLLLRHAKSSWKDPTLEDHDRPLNKRGKRAAPRMGALLKEQGFVPDVIISSTAARASATAELVASACGCKARIEYSHDLYHGSPKVYVLTLRRVPDECRVVLAIGHNPGMELLVNALTQQRTSMPTAALACVYPDITAWSELAIPAEGKLVHVWRPKELA